jgi:hypothetical protein
MTKSELFEVLWQALKNTDIDLNTGMSLKIQIVVNRV